MRKAACGVVLVSSVILCSCSSHSNEAREALVEQGYTQIELTGSPYSGCDEGDAYRNSFVATSPGGIRVKGVACAGTQKGWVIRTQGRAQ